MKNLAKRIGCALAAAITVSGCAATSPGAGSAGSGAAETAAPPAATEDFTPDIIMRCGEEQYYLHLVDDTLHVRIGSIDGEQRTLPLGVSADGARYTDGHLTLWNKGEDWMQVDEDTEETTDCFQAAVGG